METDIEREREREREREGVLGAKVVGATSSAGFQVSSPS